MSLIIERYGNGFKVRAKELGLGNNQPNVMAKNIREACLAAEHYYGGRLHAGQGTTCPFCRQVAAQAKRAKKGTP